MSNAIYLKFEKNRFSHLNNCTHPNTTEERIEEFFQKQQLQFGTKNLKKFIKNLDKMKNMAIRFDKNLEDVFLAHEYRDGSFKCKQDYEMAAKLYSKAAKCGNVEAMYNLACLTMHGKGVKQNYEMAVGLLKNAASQPAFKKIDKILNTIPVVGVAESQHLLGIIYQEGIYVNKNIDLAIYYYEMAVSNGFGGSANNLGIIYFNGDGVNVDFDKAENLFLFCHKKGCLDSISNLVDLYLARGDTTNALLWHSRALECNSLYDLSRNEIILEEIYHLNEEKKLANIPANKSIDSYLKDNFSILNFCNNNHMFKPYPIESLIYFDPKIIVQYAKRGSKFAQRMHRAQFIFYQAINDFVKNKTENNFQFASIVKRLSQAYLLEYFVCQLRIELKNELIDKLETILALNLKDELNLNASICYMHLISTNYEQTIVFVDQALKKYPDCLQMYFVKGNMLCYLEKYEQSLKEFDYLIKMDTGNYEFYYAKATSLKYIGKFSEALKNYEIFVQNCSKDDHNLPEAFYSMGLCKISQLLSSKDNNYDKIIHQYIDKGKQAEKDQLPCFLPYKSFTREILLNSIDCLRNQINSIQDKYRIELIKRFRQSFFDIQKVNLFPTKINTSMTPHKTQKASLSLDGLKEISLKQIDFTKDEVLKNFFINLRVFDYPLFGFTSVFFLVEDKNQSMELLSVYNLGEDYDKIRQDFKIGTWLAIVNPYIRQAADGKPMIRVDDVNSIKFTGKFTNKMCQYCGYADSKFNCSKCMKAFYCSKQCQVNDWKQLNHKLLCS